MAAKTKSAGTPKGWPATFGISLQTIVPSVEEFFGERNGLFLVGRWTAIGGCLEEHEESCDVRDIMNTPAFTPEAHTFVKGLRTQVDVHLNPVISFGYISAEYSKRFEAAIEWRFELFGSIGR
jgi:hypothetical protein